VVYARWADSGGGKDPEKPERKSMKGTKDKKNCDFNRN